MQTSYGKPPRVHRRELRWSSRDEAENRLFDACCDVLEAARELERHARVSDSAGTVIAATGCLSAALESLAGSAGSMRELVVGSEAIAPPGRRKAAAQRLEEVRASLRRAARACGSEAAARR